MGGEEKRARYKEWKKDRHSPKNHLTRRRATSDPQTKRQDGGNDLKLLLGQAMLESLDWGRGLGEGNFRPS